MTPPSGASPPTAPETTVRAGAPFSTASTAAERADVDVALIGPPDAGKSSLYNAITGGNAKVGNFPGVTVDVLEASAPLAGGGDAHFFDLPGVYSLGDDVDPDSDEGQARACIERLEKRGRGFVIAQVVDAAQLVLGLRLTREILGRGWPTLVLVTQRDVLEKSGARIDTGWLELELGVPVLAVSARDKDVRGRVLDAVRGLAARGFPRPAERAIDPRALAERAVKRDKRASDATARADALLLHPVLGPVVLW